MMGMNLPPCPVCGKQPKVMVDFEYEKAGLGGRTTIQCKPLLRKPHLKTEITAKTTEGAFKFAVAAWEAKAALARKRATGGRTL